MILILGQSGQRWTIERQNQLKLVILKKGPTQPFQSLSNPCRLHCQSETLEYRKILINMTQAAELLLLITSNSCNLLRRDLRATRLFSERMGKCGRVGGHMNPLFSLQLLWAGLLFMISPMQQRNKTRRSDAHAHGPRIPKEIVTVAH